MLRQFPRPIDLWRGKFGAAYADRNDPDPVRLARVFGPMLAGRDIKTILEVGCGRGSNLFALELLGYRVYGLEPNEHARQLVYMSAREQGSRLIARDGDICSLPWQDGLFDLVMTAGVLIHVPPEEIETAIKELYRVSARYILAIEYCAPTEQETPYRGLRNILWKRDYRQLVLDTVPVTVVVGSQNNPDLFAGCEWWLFQKR